MRDRAAQKGNFALPGEDHIRHEVAATVQMAGVLLALDPGSDPLRHARSRCKAAKWWSAVVALSRLCRHGEAIVVERVLGDPEPKIGIGQELLPRLVDQF